MRLGQLARKYDISIQQIISYLDKAEQAYDSHHPNSKLDEKTEALVEKHFEHLLVITSDPLDEITKEEPEQIVPEPTEAEVSEVKGTEIEEIVVVPEKETNVTLEEVEENMEEIELPISEAEVQMDIEVDDDSIATDRLLELMESEEKSVDLSKIKLIKAPKKELSGLKVVGKIDLPEPKNKDIEKSEEEETQSRLSREDRDDRRRISQEEREKRRLNGKKKKEEYELRQERRRKDKEKKERKAKKEAHYKQQLQRANSNKSANKTKPKKRKTSEELENQLPIPTTIWGRFLRWLNT